MPSEKFMAEYQAVDGQTQEPLSSGSFGAGQLVGAILAVTILTLLLRLIFRRFVSGQTLVLCSVFSAVAISTTLYAFGSADGGAPRFGAGFAQYGIGGVIVLLVLLWRDKRREAR